MNRRYMGTEERDARKKLVYHEKCVSQYRATAEKMPPSKHKDRALANADFHAEQLEHYRAIVAANRWLR